jgi:hypothetical protein
MPKRVDFAKQRRAQGRALDGAVRELATLIQPLAEQDGMDLHVRLDEASARRAEEQRQLGRTPPTVCRSSVYRRQFWPTRKNWFLCPRAVGCRLLRALTAAHVIRDAGTATFLAPSEARGRTLLPLPPCTAHLNLREGPTISTSLCWLCQHSSWVRSASASS